MPPARRGEITLHMPATLRTARQRELKRSADDSPFPNLRACADRNPIKKRKLMDEAKKKQLEAKLRQMFLNASQNREEDQPTSTKPRVIRVIRRRKGQPDTQIA